MEIIKTYIVYIEYKCYAFDDEYLKIHELKNGDFFKETDKGVLTKIDKETAKKLIKDEQL